MCFYLPCFLWLFELPMVPPHGHVCVRQALILRSVTDHILKPQSAFANASASWTVTRRFSIGTSQGCVLCPLPCVTWHPDMTTISSTKRAEWLKFTVNVEWQQCTDYSTTNCTATTVYTFWTFKYELFNTQCIQHIVRWEDMFNFHLQLDSL